VELSGLIARSQAGETAAFGELTRHYQDMAFGYALALLSDVHLAQDVTQESFLAAYLSVGNLQDPAAFPAWLRGIVRHQCGRVLRRSHADVVPFDEDLGLPTLSPGPEQSLLQREGLYRVLSAIQALPQGQREVAALSYIRDYAPREIAAFLDLPVTTVYNRLHTARKRLQGGLLTMADKIGTVVGVRGPIVDVRFEPERTPTVLRVLTAHGPDAVRGRAYAVSVAQQRGDGLVRCVAATPVEGLVPGAELADANTPRFVPVGPTALGQVLDGLRANDDAPNRARGGPQIVETGIKAIDLLCPCVEGGILGLLGHNRGVGKMVVTAEVLRNLARNGADLSVVAFFSAEVLMDYATLGEDAVPTSNRARQASYVYIADVTDPSAPSYRAAASHLDTTLYLSVTLGRLGIWPAIDPLLSGSRHLDPAVVGQEHFEVATGIRQLLLQYRSLREQAAATPGAALTPADERVVMRARKAQRFFSQPFAVAEPWSGRPGAYVSRATTVQGFKALLAGACDDVPEEEFGLGLMTLDADGKVSFSNRYA